jgi:anti-anti-sigma factor
MEAVEGSLAGVPLLRITGEVDHSTSRDLSEAVQRVLERDGSRLFLDLEDCVYFDSGGLAIILSLVRDLRGRGWLGIIAANENVLRLFEIIGLTVEQSFRLFPDQEQASLAAAPAST